MKKDRMTGNEVLEEALRGCLSSYCDQFPPHEEEIHLGEDYERYMASLIRRSEKQPRGFFRSLVTRAAGIAAAILFVFGCSMAMEEVRKPVLSFYADIRAEFGGFFAKAPDTVETVYTLGHVPKGYVEKDRFTSSIFSNMSWFNEKNERIVLRQQPLNASDDPDCAYTDWNTAYVGGRKILYSSDEMLCSYYWNSDGYRFDLGVPSNISREEALSLIESLIEYEE